MSKTLRTPKPRTQAQRDAGKTASSFNALRHGHALTLLNRYATRHHREWYRALNKLEEIQQERRDRDQLRVSPNEPEPAQPQLNQQHPRPSAFLGGPRPLGLRPLTAPLWPETANHANLRDTNPGEKC